MTQRQSERGNIFFALFGAVALVGVVGAATTSLLRGPVSTVMSVNQKTKADTQMQIASKLAMVRSAQEANNGDCDSDGTIEPLPADAMPGTILPPAGGGALPAAIGAAQLDPWNTKYGYCAWDLGVKSGDPACTGTRLGGGNNMSYPVMVIISAGADKVFQTQCNPWADATPSNAATLINKPNGSDDIILSFTYSEAVEAAGGLWSLMSGDPDTITTDKNVAFSSGVEFSSAGQIAGQATFAQNSRLDLGLGGLFLLPTDNELPDGQCNPVNNGALRLNLSDYAPATILEMCDKTIGWVALGGAGATVAKIDDLTDAISYTSDNILFLGENAGLNYSSATSTNNIGIGIGAASNLVSGDGNIVLGNGATLGAATTNSSIVLGHGVTGGGDGTLRLGNLLYGSNIYSSSGTLGIGGVPSATVKLDVDGPTESTRFQFDNSTYMGAGGGDIQWFTGATQKMVLEAGGNLGIGVTDPNVALDVSGDAEISGDAFANRFLALNNGSAASPSFTFASASGYGMYTDSGNLGFGIAGVSEMTLDANALTVKGDGLFDGYVRGTSFQFTSSAGLFPNGGGLTLNVGGNPRFYLDAFGKVGIGEAAPTTALDVSGAVKIGFVPDANCDAGRAGSIRYASGDALQVCSSITGQFETIGTSGGGGGGSASYWTRVSTIDPRLFYTAGFVGVGINDPQASLHNFGNFLNTGTFGAGAVTPVAGAGTRMMFIPNKSAFRAGTVTGTQWDHANIGNYSTAFGTDNRASGEYSTAFGREVVASGEGAFSVGRNNTASGNYSVAFGSYTYAGGWNSMTIGANAASYGNSGIAMGSNVTVGSSGNPALGERSLGLGLGTTAGTNPAVTGNSSFGIFMGDQGGVDITTNNLMALLGGRMIIDPDPTAAANVVPSGLLTLDVQGDVGAMQYCDENGANCFTAGAVAGGGVGVWEDASNVIRLTSGTVNYASASFVFGSPALNGTGIAGENTRMIFDKTKGAFRAGVASGTEWNTINLGNRSVAFGVNSIASGDNSFAVGTSAAAGGYGATAIGTNSYASGSEAFALGLSTRAEGNYAVAHGQDVRVTGANGMGFGLGGAAGTDPIVAGANSFGIFMGDQSGVNFSSARTMGLFGGRMIIDPAVPAVNLATSGTLALDVQGQIGAIEYCDANGLNCFTAAGIGSANGADGTIQYASGGKFYSSPTFMYSSASGGRVGVGTATPTQALHVVGSVRATQSLILDAVAGNAPSAMRLVDLGDTTVSAAAGGDILKYDSATSRWVNAPSSSMTVNAAGATTQIQFNSAGNFSATPMFTFDRGEVAIDGTTWNKPGVLRIKGAETPAANQFDATLILQSTAANTIWSQSLKSGSPGRNNDLVFAHYNGSIWLEPLTLATNGRIGIFSVTPAASLDINTNDAIVLPRGSDLQRPLSPVNGMIRYSSTSNKFEGFQGGTWQDILTGAATGSFLSLTDTPASYAGTAGQYVRVNAGTNALEFTDQIVGTVSGQPAPNFISLNDLSNVDMAIAPTGGQSLVYDSAANRWKAGTASGGGGTPAGATTQIQFNSAGAFGGSANFIWNNAINALSVTGKINVSDRVTIAGTAGAAAPIGVGIVNLNDVDLSVAPTGGQSLVYDSAASRWKAGAASGGGTPAGATTQIQFNSAGAFGGNANFVWNNATNALSVTGKINVSDRVVIAGTAGANPPLGMLLSGLGDVNLSVAPTGGQALVYDSAASRWKAGTVSGGGGTPAGLTTQVQFNNAGAFGADSGMTYSTGALTLTGAAATAVSATTTAAAGRALYGLASGTGVTYGVYGQTNSTTANATGVYGLANAATGATNGVYGKTNSTTGSGVFGEAITSALGQISYGVRGQANTTYGIGVAGTGTFMGVAGSTTTGTAVSGNASGAGAYAVAGYATGTGTTYGVYGSATSGSGFALYGAGNLHVTGNISYVGTLTDTSDMRLKTDIHPLRNRGSMLEKIGAIDTYSFRMKDEATRQIEFGVMAQELQKIFPELVKVDQSSPEKYLSVNYIGLISPLISATQELKAENDNLKAQLDTLETRMASMETDMQGMKVHTGYGIGRAEIGLWMVAGMGGFMIVFFFGGKIRRRIQKFN